MYRDKSTSLYRCDLNNKDESVDKTLQTPFSLTKHGITPLPDIRSSIILMLLTSLTYLVVQSADWYWGATLTGKYRFPVFFILFFCEKLSVERT